MKKERRSGILLHPTSLPGKYGIGTLGAEAYKFVDFLILSKQKLWQILPLGPTGYGDSPYQCFSAQAGNPLLIDFDFLKGDGFLTDDDMKKIDTNFDDNAVDYGKVFEKKYPVLRTAFDRYKSNFAPHYNNVEKLKFENFCAKNADWLDDYALFMAIKEDFDKKPWYKWEHDIKMREPEAVERYTHKLHDDILFQKFIQYLFFKQWLHLKSYANINGIEIIGDIPIYISHDSVEAWSDHEIFEFDEERNPKRVAGVPPDYFSETGQLWGNPLYNWDKLEETGFQWWLKRIEANLLLYDIIRIDHFRGLAAYWAVPFGEKTAQNGEWVNAPGEKLLDTIFEKLGNVPIIAEDLGVITPDVVHLREKYALPGMKILQFAFDSDEENDFLPHTYPRNCVVYNGTHDNDTIVGWFTSANENDKNAVREYLFTDGNEIHWAFIRLAMASVAYTAVTPLQDVMGLGNDARMNTPSTANGNWQWRFKFENISDFHIEKLRKLTTLYGR